MYSHRIVIIKRNIPKIFEIFWSMPKQTICFIIYIQKVFFYSKANVLKIQFQYFLE